MVVLPKGALELWSFMTLPIYGWGDIPQAPNFLKQTRDMSVAYKDNIGQ